MKSIVVLTLGLMVGGSLATAQDSTKQARIERILALTNAENMLDQMLAQIKTATPSTIPGATPEQVAKVREIQSQVMDLVKARLNWDKLRPQIAKIYDETFSEDEIDGILAFYQSPAGQGMLKKMPRLMAQTMTMVQSLMGDIMPDIQRIVREATPPAKQ